MQCAYQVYNTLRHNLPRKCQEKKCEHSKGAEKKGDEDAETTTKADCGFSFQFHFGTPVHRLKDIFILLLYY